MALKLYNETDIEAIADAIRGKNGSSDTYTVSQMAQAIDDIPSGGGGSLPASCKFYTRITLTSDATSSNRLSVQLPSVDNYAVVVFCVDATSAPASGYSALGQFEAYWISKTSSGTILRSNGTQGTDNNLFSYTPSTGVLLVGGQYGTFHAGKSYDIYLFEHGGIAS